MRVATAPDTFAHNDDRDGFRSGAGHVAIRAVRGLGYRLAVDEAAP